MAWAVCSSTSYVVVQRSLLLQVTEANLRPLSWPRRDLRRVCHSSSRAVEGLEPLLGRFRRVFVRATTTLFPSKVTCVLSLPSRLKDSFESVAATSIVRRPQAVHSQPCRSCKRSKILRMRYRVFAVILPMALSTICSVCTWSIQTDRWQADLSQSHISWRTGS